MDVQGLIPRLTSEFGYPQAGAVLVADKLANLTSPVREAFKTWWESNAMPDVEVEGYTIRRLEQEHGMKPIAAFLTLDWLNREPAKALRSLRKGHDRVG